MANNGSVRSDPELNQAVQSFLALMWQHVDATIRAALHQHHKEHEPGGKDKLRIPVSFLADVDASDPVEGDTLVYKAATKLWEHGPGGGVHQAHLGTPLPIDSVPPGPTNITGKAFRVIAWQASSDGACEGSIGGCGGFSFSLLGAAGGTQGGSNYTVGLSDWGTGSTITIDGLYVPVDSVASYLAIDLAIR